jgi:hypothetical protein
VAVLEVGADKSVLAAEEGVERRLRHPSALGDPVNADGVHAFVVEQLAGRGQQPLTR